MHLDSAAAAAPAAATYRTRVVRINSAAISGSSLFTSSDDTRVRQVLGTLYKSHEVFSIQSHPDEKQKEQEIKRKNKRAENEKQAQRCEKEQSTT